VVGKRIAAAAIIGLGVGYALGSQLPADWGWAGAAPVVVGLLVAGWARSDLSPGPVDGPPPPPRMAELGNKVESILRLAEEQAQRHVEQARSEAAAIIADAHQRARAGEPEQPR
jgi:hypothetical protein